MNPNDVPAVADWLQEYREELWDKQIEADAKAGRLDKLMEEAKQGLPGGSLQAPSMNNLTSPRFWRHYNSLVPEIQKLADKNFQLFKSNPQHPSLHFDRKKPDIWSVRAGGGHRALARQLDDNLIWFWIDPHDDY